MGDNAYALHRIPASRYQDATTSPSARRKRSSCAQQASTAPGVQRSWRSRNAPLLMGTGCARFCLWFARRLKDAACGGSTRRAN